MDCFRLMRCQGGHAAGGCPKLGTEIDQHNILSSSKRITMSIGIPFLSFWGYSNSLQKESEGVLIGSGFLADPGLLAEL